MAQVGCMMPKLEYVSVALLFHVAETMAHTQVFPVHRMDDKVDLDCTLLQSAGHFQLKVNAQPIYSEERH